MPALGLTHVQANLLSFIRSEIGRTGIAPTFNEMQTHLGLKSKSGIHRILVGIEERGHIVRLENRARAIALTDCCPHCGRPQ